MSTRTYAPFDSSDAPAVDPTRPIRVVLHTVTGWVFVGDYATWRGSYRALANAERKLETVPRSARTGSSDNTFAAQWDTGHDGSNGGYVAPFEYGVFDAGYRSRRGW